MKYQGEECDKKLEVYRPIVNLVHNMVNMGSLYGGDNLMLASQYRKVGLWNIFMNKRDVVYMSIKQQSNDTENKGHS